MHTHTTSMEPRVAGLKAGTNPMLYVVAALTATLAVAVVVTVFFVVLSPAHISFSVSHARSSRGSKDGVLELVLTLAANNTSQRAAVKYESMFVDVSNSTGPQLATWIRADVTTAMPLSQGPASVVNVGAKLSLVPGTVTNAFTGNWTTKSFSVTVTAVARFKVGVARTRLYDIKVSCRPVSFFAGDGAEQNGGAPSRLPVACV